MKKSIYATPCGLYCGTCPELEKSCKGKPCMECSGEMFWGTCELYKCCVEKHKLEHCGLCDEFPCKLFLEHNDPSLTKEEAERQNKARRKELRERAKIGTEKWVEKFK